MMNVDALFVQRDIAQIGFEATLKRKHPELPPQILEIAIASFALGWGAAVQEVMAETT